MRLVLFGFLFCFVNINATNYFVSSSEGNDSNNGLSEATPFASIAKVNSLNLQPGDTISFKCGDTWRGEMLTIVKSGSSSLPIVFRSYPVGGSQKPIISGAFPVSEWSHHAGNIYVANLQTGANAGLFPQGINQVFRQGVRLVEGRWPNPGEGTFSDGYSEIDGPSGNSNRIVDTQLPAGNWAGAMAHIKGMRWYILNRVVTSSSGTTLNLNASTDCWAGSCVQWGYFLNNHLATLDRDGEWFYNQGSGQLYLFSDSGTPANIEASAIVGDPDRYQGGIILGQDLQDHISYITIDNIEISKWFMHGITTPLNWETDDNSNILIQNCLISDVDGIGINLASWVWNASNGANGWRGGHQIQILNNEIHRANHFGINSYAYNSTLSGNLLTEIGLIELAGKSGIGCGDDTSGGFCTESGDGIRIKIDNPAWSGHHNTLENNRIIRAGYCGFDVFGSTNTLHNNYVEEACFSKGDCGAIRTFGNGSLGNTPVYDLAITDNIFIDTIGNTDGAHPTYRSLFGFGIYIDHYSENTLVQGNAVINSTASGILFQDSTGDIIGNTSFNSSKSTSWSAQINLASSITRIGELSQNIMFGQHGTTWTLRAPNLAAIQNSDQNSYFNLFKPDHISVQGDKTLAQWQAFSGMDAASKEHWFTLTPGDDPPGRIFYNDSFSPIIIDLAGSVYKDLDQNTVTGSIELQPFGSRVLIVESLCVVNALLSGDTTICSGGTADLEVMLAGQPPWDIEWSDGLVQSGIANSPLTRSVSPSEDTTFSIISVTDTQCTQPGSGTATVLVGTESALNINPSWLVQGLNPLQITAEINCLLDVQFIEWYLDDQLISQGSNPLVFEFTTPGPHALRVDVLPVSGPEETAAATLLVAHFPEFNADPDGDQQNSINDLRTVLPLWLTTSSHDPDNNGKWDVRDYLFIATVP